MKLAIITDSTCDLPAPQLERLQVKRVPLYVNFQGKTYRDWVELTPKEIIEGVQAGAGLPSTSQPSPQDFENAYREALEQGAESILVITISSKLSGTHQSAVIAKEALDIPITIFDSMAASIGMGSMVIKAARMRDEGADVNQIIRALEAIRTTNRPFFSVASLDFLQKGGRIGRASALLGGLLNIKPILSLDDGVIAPIGRARGAKKALAEVVSQVKEQVARHPGTPHINFLHVQDPAAADKLADALRDAGIEYTGGDSFEIGAVVASHVGPGTYGLYMHMDEE